MMQRILETGELVLSKAGEEELQTLSVSEFALDPQIAASYAELREKLSGLQTEWGSLSGDIQQNEQSLAEREQLAQEGYKELEQLLKRVQALRSELDKKGPPGALPSIVEQQLAEMQEHLNLTADIDTAVASLKERLQVCLYAMLCYAMLCYAMLCYAMLCYAMLCYAMLCYAMLCYAMLYYAMLCYAMLCYAMLCYAIL